jgi:SAM-dependent methyltransferase
MAFNPATKILLDSAIYYLLSHAQITKKSDIRLLELGSQTLKLNLYQVSSTLQGASHALYEDLGIGSWNTIDINPTLGALQVDLAQPFSEIVGSDYHIVLNNGVSEHVHDDRNVFIEIHRSLALGGVALHLLPANDYYHHAFRQYCPDLATLLAGLLEEEVLDIGFASRTGTLLSLLDEYNESRLEAKYIIPRYREFHELALHQDQRWDGSNLYLALRKVGPHIYHNRSISQCMYTDRPDNAATAVPTKQLYRAANLNLYPFPYLSGRSEDAHLKQLSLRLSNVLAVNYRSGNKNHLFRTSQLLASNVVSDQDKYFIKECCLGMKDLVLGLLAHNQLTLYRKALLAAFSYNYLSEIRFGIRDLHVNADIELDFQYGFNSPVLTDGPSTSVRRAHHDDSETIFNGLIYYPDDTHGKHFVEGSCSTNQSYGPNDGFFQILRQRKPSSAYTEVKDQYHSTFSEFSLCSEISPRPGNFVFFINSQRSWHQVSHRTSDKRIRAFFGMVVKIKPSLDWFKVLSDANYN